MSSCDCCNSLFAVSYYITTIQVPGTCIDFHQLIDACTLRLLLQVIQYRRRFSLEIPRCCDKWDIRNESNDAVISYYLLSFNRCSARVTIDVYRNKQKRTLLLDGGGVG